MTILTTFAKFELSASGVVFISQKEGLMGFPGEEIVTKAVESLSSSLIRKMDAAEARRERDFSLKLKELEFYKSNYDKELKKIFVIGLN